MVKKRHGLGTSGPTTQELKTDLATLVLKLTTAGKKLHFHLLPPDSEQTTDSTYLRIYLPPKEHVR